MDANVFTFFLGVILILRYTEDAGAQMMLGTPCCKRGRSSVARKHDIKCEQNIARLSGVNQQPICMIEWTACCLGAKQKLRCDEGIAKARQNTVCNLLREGGKANEQERCCSCCRVGFQYGIDGRNCQELLAFSFASDCNNIAKSCCDDLKRDSRLKTLITKGRPRNRKTCKDRPCSHICVTTSNGYRCLCRRGYTLQTDGISCKDINECALLPNICGSRGKCINLFGGHYCSCERGYKHIQVTGKCVDIDECKERKPCSHICKNTNGSYTCACPSGYYLGGNRRTCARISTQLGCRNNRCVFRCQSLGRWRHQCLCPSGYRLANDYTSCRDINECATQPNACGQGTVCFNTYGSYKCVPTTCPRKYQKKTSLRYCVKTTCSAGDTQCRNDPTYSYQWMPSALLSGIKPRRAEYYYTLSKPSFPSDVRFSIGGGNDGTFYLQPAGKYKVFLRNQRALTGPRDYRIELHIDIYTNNRLYTRLVNVFFIFVSSFTFA